MFSLNKKISSIFITAVIVFFGCNADAQNINSPNKKGPLGTQVNTYTGNLYIPRNDIYVPARGLDLDISFYYNSYNFDQASGFGNGWSFYYSIKYAVDTAGNNVITWGDGREDLYTALPGGGFKSPTGFFDTLTNYQPNKYSLTETGGTKYYFDNSTTKKITKILERNGNYINFNYSDSLLTSIVNNEGQTISLIYDGTGKLTTVVDAITTPSRTWTYTYDGAGNLKQVTDPLGGTNKYTYLVNGPMKTLSDKNSNTVDIIYYGDYSVSELIGCNKRQSFSYDSTANVAIVTDYVATGNNQVTTYGYTKINGLACLTSLISNCCGYNMKFEFDNNGNKTKQTDANGNVSTYSYDSRGNVLTMTDPLNQTATITYSASFNSMTSFTDPLGNKTTTSYDNAGNLTQLVSPGNLVCTATYNSNGDMISSADPKGNIFTYNYDPYGNPVSVNGPNGYHATLAFDARGHLLSYTDARGNTSNIEYDILDRLKKITDPVNNSVQLTYDAEGNATTVKNQNNETAHLNYDASNRMVQFTDAVNNKSSIVYDAIDNTVAEKNALGNTTSYTYDTRNRLSSVTDALGNTGNLSYDANGNVTTVSMPNGEQLSYTYDKLDRVAAIHDNTGNIASIAYDKNNNIKSYTNATGAVTTANYDSLDRIRQITDPLGNSSSFTYDKNDNISTVTDRNGFVNTYTYDNMNRVKTYSDNNGFITSITYDTEGNVISAKDQNNNITNYVYDSLNRVKTTTYADGKFMQCSYDKKWNMISRRLTDGSTIGFVYDSLNRMVQKILPGGNIFTYTYDAIGRVITAANGSGIVSITYDALNRITSETFDGRTTRYDYNIAGRTQTIIYPDSTTIIKTFDTRNRLTGIARGNNNLVAYQYNNADQAIAKTFANGVVTNLQYDFANRLNGYNTGNGSIQNTSYSYDKEINKQTISRLNDPSLSEQFTYDNAYRTTTYKRGPIGGSPTVQNTYNFDALGNRISANLNGTSTTYTANNLNQLTSSNNGSQNIIFTYDNNGNLTYDGQFYKSYDAEGRLLKDSSAAINVLSYLYDAFGRRVQKVYNGVPLKYTYAGLSQIEERDGITGDLKTRTIFKNFLTPVVNEKNNNEFYYHQNELNSVEAITNSSGNVTESYRYDVYGKQTIYDGSGVLITSSLAGNRFGFTGQEYDSANNSNHFVFRNYSPVTGTFNQRDPIGYEDGMGMYQYLNDNPANGIDVFGLDGGHSAGYDGANATKNILSILGVSENWVQKFKTPTDAIKFFTAPGNQSANAAYLQALRLKAFLDNPWVARLSAGLKGYFFLSAIYDIVTKWKNTCPGDKAIKITDATISGFSLLYALNKIGLIGNTAWKMNPVFKAYTIVDAISKLLTGNSLLMNTKIGAESHGQFLANNPKTADFEEGFLFPVTGPAYLDGRYNISNTVINTLGSILARPNPNPDHDYGPKF
jgi:RHS repeat-associated protein